jgi:hypothetical protein
MPGLADCASPAKSPVDLVLQTYLLISAARDSWKVAMPWDALIALMGE